MILLGRQEEPAILISRLLLRMRPMYARDSDDHFIRFSRLQKEALNSRAKYIDTQVKCIF